MNKILYCCILCFSISLNSISQNFCFTIPNLGPHYNNGSSGAIYDVVSGDFNNDGHIDIVTANSTGGSISFIRGNGDGTLGTADTFAASGVQFAIDAADLDDDGNLDVVTANGYSVLAFYGNGDGTFKAFKTYQATGTPSRLYLEDITGDNKEDIIIAGSTEITILHQVSNNSFSWPVTIPAGGEVNDLTLDYFDNDTIKDIVAVVREQPSVSKLAFFKGNNVGLFALPVYYNVPHYSIFGINSMDVDMDGNMDLIVGNHNLAVSRIEVYYGNGDGTFSAPDFIPAFTDPTYIYLEDMDNDGTEDILAVDGSGFTIVKINNDATFTPYENFASMPAPNSLAIADFNEDGKKDVVVPSAYSGSGLIGMNINCTSTGIKSFVDKGFKVFPNPVADQFTLEFNLKEPSEVSVTIADISGKALKTIAYPSATAGNHSINVSLEHLTAGIYCIQFHSEELTINEFVVKQ